tara:strand:+ start:2911 stop:3222 length:312 start_codon:yes stop_codon:yes gene_type:complete
MLERVNQPNDTVVSANKEKLLSVFPRNEEIFLRRFIREILSLRFQGCFEEITDLIGVTKGSEIYCYACDEVIENIDRNAPTSIVTRDTTEHLESVHGIVSTAG